MLYLNLKPILEARQIEKPYSFLVKIGIAPHTAHKILSNNTHVLRLDNLTLICKALHCQPNDLLVYRPNPTNLPIAQNHPLNKLIQTPADNLWQQQLKTMPLDKLKQLTQLINNVETQDEEEITTNIK
jgi:DNA-binding Xre family transcriptional regulator